ncbi:SDR family oxidoreductase [Erythrobacter sp. HA6-11]
MTTILITGANRGIGLEHTKQALEAGETVIATCRKPGEATELASLAEKHGTNLKIEELDVTCGEFVCSLVGRLDGVAIDVLINNAGTAGDKSWDPSADRQSLGSIDYEQWRWILDVNLLGAMRVTEALYGNVAASDKKQIIMISSGLASIAHNTMGGSHLYRTSKAALNMLAKGVANDLADRGITTISLSPGWTKTDMGGDAAHWTVKESVRQQRQVIAGLSFADNGKFYELQGEEVPW